MLDVRRREFIAMLGGAAAAWPVVARAQQRERMRRIGILMTFAADDLEGRARVTAFMQALQQLGWADGRNVRIDARWGLNADLRKFAAELVELAPDVILTSSSVAVAAIGPGQFAAIQAVAPSLGVELRPVNVRDAGEIERAIATFAQSANGGLIVTGSTGAAVHRELIIALAARHRLPAVYNSRFWTSADGLMSYGPDFLDQFQRAASYVDRILKGEKPADLPVQAPTKYELVINLKTAKALGLDVPVTLLARADEVIE